MKCIILFILFILFILIFSCQNESLEPYLSSDNKDSLIRGLDKVRKRDFHYIPLILNNADDPRRTYQLDYKGKTVYEVKMITMKKISGKEPPIPISEFPDSAVINYYRAWAVEKGYLKEEE